MLVLATAIVSSGCTRGSGVSATDTRVVDEFNAIDVGGALSVNVQVGSDPKVEITGDDNIVPEVTTEVRDGTLHLELEGRFSHELPLTITITNPTLEEVDASGASRVTIQGIHSESFEADISGASSVKLAGTVATLDADVSGASVLEAKSLVAARGKVEAGGASTAAVHATEAIDIEASGASSVSYSGSPDEVSRDASGSSKITAR